MARRGRGPAQVRPQRRTAHGPRAGSSPHVPLAVAQRATPAPWVAAVGRRRAARNDVRVIARYPPRAREGGEDRFAVVVVTYNRRTEVMHSLECLEGLPEKPYVVVVDNASRDGTAQAVVDNHPWAELLVLDRNAGAVGRNVAVNLLSHPYIAFADDDTWWEPGSLRRAADVLDAHPAVAVLTARIVVEPTGVEDPVVEDMRCSPLTDDGRVPGHPLLSVLAGASMVRRSAFVEVGGFEPLLRLGGEEELLSADLLAAGWSLRYLPELTVHHAPSPARGPHRRRAEGLRNTLWCTWLRRPLLRAAWRSFALLRRAPHDRITAGAVIEALRGLPWVLRERRLLPPEVEREFRLLDAQQLNSRARRYIS